MFRSIYAPKGQVRARSGPSSINESSEVVPVVEARTGERRSSTASSTDRILLEEARRNELKLAYLRPIWVGAFAALYLVIHLRPGLAGLTNYPRADSLRLAACALAAAGLLAALRRGWYEPWLRWVVPLADALVIWGTFALVLRDCAPCLPFGTLRFGVAGELTHAPPRRAIPAGAGLS